MSSYLNHLWENHITNSSSRFTESEVKPPSPYGIVASCKGHVRESSSVLSERSDVPAFMGTLLEVMLGVQWQLDLFSRLGVRVCWERRKVKHSVQIIKSWDFQHFSAQLHHKN